MNFTVEITRVNNEYNIELVDGEFDIRKFDLHAVHDFMKKFNCASMTIKVEDKDEDNGDS